MRLRTRIVTAVALALGVAGTFYFKSHPIVRGCADTYYAGGACHQAAVYSYSIGYYASLALVGLTLFSLTLFFLRRKNT